MINTKPILSIKGISKIPSAFAAEKPDDCRKDKSTHLGRNLNITEKMKPPMVAKRAALEVAFFQKKPRINMAKIPGETNPVYS